MLVNITCPQCNTSGGFSISDECYIGPYRCWKCRATMKIHLEKTRLESCELMSEEEFTHFEQEMEIRRRAHGER
ncbi:MAG: hypothetical protein E4H31_02745 [Dehalococcoidia bacterium]|nr:MAG: hypothetical protein E4H31_02745 [Dehalococcoidia bacterium]